MHRKSREKNHRHMLSSLAQLPVGQEGKELADIRRNGSGRMPCDQ